MLSSEIAKIVIFEVNLDHPAPVSPLNKHGQKIFLLFFVHVILPGSNRAPK
jgi:hypothetical protein